MRFLTDDELLASGTILTGAVLLRWRLLHDSGAPAWQPNQSRQTRRAPKLTLKRQALTRPLKCQPAGRDILSIHRLQIVIWLGIDTTPCALPHKKVH